MLKFTNSNSQDEFPVYSVSEVIQSVNLDFEENYGLIWIKGEVGEVSPSSKGHVYFKLKDEKDPYVISAVIFKGDYMRMNMELIEGRVIIVRGELTIYPQRGQFQVIVKSFVDAGAGLLALQFEALKKKLMEEGLTDESRKRSIPLVPRTIGIVTSLEAAALQDMLRVLKTKIPARIVISHASVQGEEAPAELVRALERLEKLEELDVVIIGRGGGSAEDLAPFNDENLARKIAFYRVPIISAVGHEVDYTICDLVADKRAPTPTAAAQMVIADRDEIERKLENFRTRFLRLAEGAVSKFRNKLFYLTSRLVSPQKMVMMKRLMIDDLDSSMESALKEKFSKFRIELQNLSIALHALHPGYAISRKRNLINLKSSKLEKEIMIKIEGARSKFGSLTTNLDALSPLKVLSRGYAIATRVKDGKIMKSPADVEDGERITLRLHEGILPCEARKKQ